MHTNLQQIILNVERRPYPCPFKCGWVGHFQRDSQGCAAEQRHAITTHGEAAATYYTMLTNSMFAKTEAERQHAKRYLAEFEKGPQPTK